MMFSTEAFDANADTTILTQPRVTGMCAMVDQCRETLLTFLNDSQHWGKAELAMWLMGPYTQVSQFGQSVRSGERAVPLLRDIDARMVQRVIRAARDEVFSVIARLSDSEGAASFTFAMLASGFVTRCEDAQSVLGFVPTTGARRLADRVLSLLAADYMTRAQDYDTLAVCAHCNSVDFDAHARLRGICHRHASIMLAPMGIRRGTRPYPEGA